MGILLKTGTFKAKKLFNNLHKNFDFLLLHYYYIILLLSLLHVLPFTS